MQQDSRGITTRVFTILTIVVGLGVVLRRAWVSDDAFITLRTVENFTNGLGLVYNVGERVQTYTHPLWLFLLSIFYGLKVDPIIIPILLSLVLTLATFVLLVRFIAVSRLSFFFGLLILIFSNAFIDYSTSGLENPLTHFLLVAFFALFFLRRHINNAVFWLSLVAALAAVNRLDTILFYIPPLLFSMRQNGFRRSLRPAILGQLPLLLWLAFSLFYYGFVLPNTAYAKLSTGIPKGQVLAQGVVYYLNSLNNDMITLAAVGTAILFALVSRKNGLQMIAVGALLYLGYILYAGGDFMSGRFFSAPLLVAVVILMRLDLEELALQPRLALFGLVILMGVLAPNPTLGPLTAETEVEIPESGIVDERQFWFPRNTLYRDDGRQLLAGGRPNEGVQFSGRVERIEVLGAAGKPGFFLGPSVHVIDRFALLDPLLARLPSVRDDDWRIGHFLRYLPDGYQETLESGKNQIADQNLAQYYDKLVLITRGRLWDPDRLLAIVKVNLGLFDDLIDYDAYRHPRMAAVEVLDLARPAPNELPWNDSDNTLFDWHGIRVLLDEPSHARFVELSLDGDTEYTVAYFDGGKEIGHTYLRSPDATNEQLFVYLVEIPKKAINHGFSQIRIFPRVDDGTHSLGHLRLWGPDEWSGCPKETVCGFDFSDGQVATILDDGWSVPEEWGVWSGGEAVSLRLYLDEVQDYALQLQGFPVETADTCNQDISLIINGSIVGQASTTTCGSQTFEFEISAEYLTPGINEFQFGFSHTASPTENGDRRQLGLGFESLTLTPQP